MKMISLPFFTVSLLMAATSNAFAIAGRKSSSRTSFSLSSAATTSLVEQESDVNVSNDATAPPSWEDLKALLEDSNQAKQPESKKPLVTLYRDTNGWCPFCERVWLALEIKKIPYQEQLINLQDKPGWFLQMVPTGLVPAVLFHTEQIGEENEDETEQKPQPERSLIWESLDILKALDEQFPDTPRLVQDDNEDYQKAREIASQVSTAGVQFLYGGRNATVTDEEKAEKKEAFLSALKDLDTFLGSNEQGSFCCGDSITGVDIEIIPTMERWRYQLPITADFNLYDSTEFPNIVKWFDALEDFVPYYRRVAGDAYSWTAVASTFLRYFATGPDGTMSEQTKEKIEKADAAAQALTSSFDTTSVFEETTAAKQEAATKILSNYKAIVGDCTNEDPKSQKELARASDGNAADTILRAVAHSLLTSTEEDSATILVDDSVNTEQAAIAAETVAARLCVPRDMGAPAAQVLRKTLTQAAEAFRSTVEN